MEFKIVNSIKIDPNQPSIFCFMQKIANFANFGAEKTKVAQMLCEFMLVDSRLLQYRPSILGAVAIFASNKLMQKQRCWNAGL